jgi:hypothetical protein
LSGFGALLNLIPLLFIGSWGLGMLEALGTLFFIPAAFEFGPIAATVECSAPDVALPTDGASAVVGDMKYRVVEGAVLFRRRYYVFETRFRTPYELKGTLRWQEGRFVATARYPVGLPAFVAFWLVGMGVVGMTASVSAGAWGATVIVLAVGAVVAVGLSYLNRHELEAFPERVDDVIEAIAGTTCVAPNKRIERTPRALS